MTSKRLKQCSKKRSMFSSLKGVDGFNGFQRFRSTQLNTIQRQPSMPPKSPGEVTTRTTGSERLKVEIVAMTLTPPFGGQPGRSMASGTAARKKSVARIKRRLWKCRSGDGEKTVGRIKRRRVRRASHVKKSQGCSSLSRQTRRRKLRLGSRRSCRMLSRSRHKSSYMQSRLMCRCPLRRTSGARVSAVSSLNRSDGPVH